VEEVRSTFIVFVMLCGGQLCVGQNVGVPAAQFKNICASERKANIDLTSIRALTGRVRDQTGASFSDEYAIELRNPSTGRVLKTKSLDHEGRFSLEEIQLGRVNLLLVHVSDGQPKRTGFETPAHLQCGGGPTCNLEIVLKAGSTDDIKDQCPLT
jgi:hypothetical protein